MEGKTRNANKIMDTATSGMQDDIYRNKDITYQTHGIQRICHDIKITTH